MYRLPETPKTLECPFCKAVIPWDERLFLDHDYIDEDGDMCEDWTECCENCFDELA